MTAATKRIRVVFLTFYFEAWDALADIHGQMLADDRFEVSVIAIPRRFSGDVPFGEVDRVSEFLALQGVAHEVFDFENSFEGLAGLKRLAPDYIFINYPWQRNYQPGYRVEELSEFTKVCYVPYYSLALVNEPGETGVTPYLYTQRSNQLASLVFTQDPNTLDAYAQTERGNGYVHLTGTPKLDGLIRKVATLKPEVGNTLGWAPHHSFSESWLNFGTFPSMFQKMLDFAKKRKFVQIALRPHPIMFETLVRQNIISQEVLADWIDQWNSLPNTSIDSGGDIAAFFANSEFLLTDGISFLGEYPLATGKPAFFIENPGHWPWSPIGGRASAANIHCADFEEFVAAFDSALVSGLPDFSEEIDSLRDAAQPYPGLAASKIIEVVVDDFTSGTPLVDKSTVTTTPWERLPGAEAAWD